MAACRHIDTHPKMATGVRTGFSTLLGSTVYSSLSFFFALLLLLLCLFVNFVFQTSEQGFFGAGNFFGPDRWQGQ